MARRTPEYDPANREIKFSRTALDEFLKCPRCFYQARRLGRKRPSIPAMSLNLAVDALLKREFDAFRAQGTPHPVMAALPGDLIPFAHASLDDWRNNFRGVQVAHEGSGFVVTGAPDDLWLDRDSRLVHVVDYKSTSSAEPATLETPYRVGWKRQVEVYQWLLRGNDIEVADTAYFLFQNADKQAGEFGGVLRFAPEIVAHEGDTGWVEDALVRARAVLDADTAPEADPGCELCTWTASALDD